MTNRQIDNNCKQRSSSSHESGTRRAIHLLKHIVSNQALSFSELETRTSIPKASLHRLLNELKVENVINFDEQRHKWTPGFTLIELGIQALSSHDIRSISYPFLQRLNLATEETIQLSVLHHANALIIDQIRSPHRLGYCVDIGHSTPAHSCAAGKALLAFVSTDVLDDLFENIMLEKVTPHTVICKRELVAQLSTIREKGMANSIEESSLGLRDYAAPITNGSKEAVAAISIVVPESRVDSSLLDDWLNELIIATEKISRLMLLSN